MKILHAVHNFPPEFVGGTEAYVSALAREQARRGHQVSVLAGSEQSGLDRLEEEWEGIRVERLRHDTDLERYSVDYRLPRLRPLYRDMLRRLEPDLVHVHHYLNLGVPLVGDAARLGIPAVCSLHDFTAVCPRFFLIRPDGAFCGDELPVPGDRCHQCCAVDFDGSDEELAEQFRLRRAFFDAELSAADSVIVPSEKTLGYLRESGILGVEPRFEVVPLGLLDDLRPVDRVPADEERLRLVFFGNVAAVKGVDLLLEALTEMDQFRRGRVSLLILGRPTDPELEERIRQLVGDLVVRREETFDRARLERLPAEADVAVFAGTAAETYSLVVDEALALGLPVIVSDRGAAAERAGSAALVVETGSVAALTRAVKTLIDKPERLERMRSAAKAQVFTIGDGADRLDELYQRALETGANSQTTDGLDSERLFAGDRVNMRLRRERDQRVASDGVIEATFDPSFRFRPLRDFATVPGGHVVVLAPHPDDEIIGAGGAVALHTARGDRVTVVHLTDGAGGDREGRERGEIASVRKAEARAAGELLGVGEFAGLDFPDGSLRPDGAFLAGVQGLLDSLRPDVLYVPSPFEHHPDHRAACHLAALVAPNLEHRPVLLLYEVNEPQQPSYLLDISSVLSRKEQALGKFASQQAYMDIVRKTLDANRARTVNVDLPEVVAAEAYLEISTERLADYIRRVSALRAFVDDPALADAVITSGSEAGEASQESRTLAPVSAVISTWNKRDDVRENLLALYRQTTPPAEIIVVDNASTDGTQEMITAEFPDVRLVVMNHDGMGACETFNIGFRAAKQPFIAIMDDDVAAPPGWLETLVRRMKEEPDTTGMISSKVIEPGMPEEFLSSEAVNRPRYMATFRGCGTLAKSEVMRRAGYYDELFFIYGNERDLAARVLNLGYRILQWPAAEIFHKTPFGMKAGKRSLYYHVRNFWLYAFKNCSWRQVFRAGWILGLKGLGLGGDRGQSSDATGTIGIDRSVKETPGGVWIAFKATLSALTLLPHCLKHRSVCRSEDFEPPVG